MRNLEKWLKEQKLAKSIFPSHFRGLVQTMDKSGERLVDFKNQSRDLPPQLSHLPAQYKEDVLEHPEPAKKQFDDFSGASSKLIYQGGANDNMYMLKPYHEGIYNIFKGFMRFPIQGWAELANQALYHAGGIGHLHQQVHGMDHDTDRAWSKVPMLVVHMSKDHQNSWGDSLGNVRRPDMDDVRKVGLMDFLTNNLDRHADNLLTSPDSVLAIDHGRSFQYLSNQGDKWDDQYLSSPDKWDNSGFSDRDSLNEYLAEFGRLSHSKGSGYSAARYRPILEDWWAGHSEPIAREFDRQLGYIKDSGVREHLQRNFYARKDLLDGQAAKFEPRRFSSDSMKVPIYAPSSETIKRWTSNRPDRRHPDDGQ